ncbi:MAG: hypothetical protein ACMX3H_08860 [Sodalis sp. (in: enterobacteria)]|uniref:hypothetical protein n=1 Tax=Sodalis sp. (in: enterobacteria) TaxID=1898979 RepID=UPI0039E2B2CF
MESRIGPFWPLIVLTLALQDGAQSAIDSQGGMTAAGEASSVAASEQADIAGVTQTTDTAAAPMDMPVCQEVVDEVNVYTGPDGIDVLVLR